MAAAAGQPQQGRQPIQQPAHAGAGRRVEPRRQPPLQRLLLLRRPALEPVKGKLRRQPLPPAAAPGGPQQPQGGAPRFAHGQVAPRQGEGPQRGDSAELGGAHPQGLTAPELVVVPEAAAIPGHPQGGARAAVFRQHRQQVSVVVLQRQQRQLPVLVQGRRPLAGAVAGMAVAGQGRGVQLVARQPGQGRLLQSLGCGGGAEIPQVGAEQAVARQAQGQGPFAVGTEGQGTGRCRWCRQGQGGQAAAQPQHQRPLGRPAHHAVVTGVDDRQAVAEHRIGQLGQDGSIAEGIPGDRLTAAIGAGGHQHPTALLEQQLLQTTRGAHHPQPGAGARHGWIDGDCAATAHQQDRCHRGVPQLLFGGLGVAMPRHPGGARQ